MQKDNIKKWSLPTVKSFIRSPNSWVTENQIFTKSALGFLGCSVIGVLLFTTLLSQAKNQALTEPIPTNVFASDGTHTGFVRISWHKTGADTVYKVYRGTSCNIADMIPLDLYWRSGPSFNDSTAEAGKIYYYRVKAKNDVTDEISDYSDCNSGYWGQPNLSEPTGLTATDGTHSDKVVITCIKREDTPFYRLYRSTSSDMTTELRPIANWQEATYWEDDNVEKDVLYYYAVRAAANTVADFYTAYSNVDSGYKGEEAPESPTDVDATDGEYVDHVVITWTSTALNYQVFRKEENTAFTLVSRGWQTGHSFQDFTAEVGKTYQYTVKVANSISGQYPSEFGNIDEGWRTRLVKAKLKVFLEGVYEVGTESMKTTLHNKQLVSTEQPFSTSPWCYNGTETVTTFPSNTVDWILLDIVKADGAVVTRKAGLLLADGTIVSPTEATQEINLGAIPTTESYRIIVRPRNHLAISTPTSLQVTNNQLVFDFTTYANNAGKLKEISPNIFALHAGDLNADGLLSIKDYNIYLQQAATINQYKVADANLDGNVTTKDFNFYQWNVGKIGAGEVRLEGNCE